MMMAKMIPRIQSQNQMRTLVSLLNGYTSSRNLSINSGPRNYYWIAGGGGKEGNIFRRSMQSTSWVSSSLSRCRHLHTSQSLSDTHIVKMPSLSPTMSEGTIVKWMKKEGDKVAPGDVLCEIQTDKAVMSMEYEEEGILAKILVPENTADVKVGTLIALTVDEGDDWKSVEVPADAGAGEAPKAAASGGGGGGGAKAPAAAAPPSSSSSGSGGSGGGDRLVGPAVKNYLRQYGLDSSKVKGTGPKGTLLKADVLKHIQSNNLQPVAGSASAPAAAGAGAAKKPKAKATGGKATPATYVDLEISGMRKTIAKRLLQSKSTIPHAYGNALCNMKSLNDFRKMLGSLGIKVSVNDLLIKCVANALSMNPAVNCIWEKNQLMQMSDVDISIAVATPSGLITPIVHDAANKDVVEISSLVKILAGKAKDGKLKPQEYQGGSFCISNLGMFGIHSFSAIINPPQCAILAVGGTSVEIDEYGETLSTSKLALSYDGSAIMEDEAMKFLAVLKREVENTSITSMGVFDLEQIQNHMERQKKEAAAAGKK